MLIFAQSFTYAKWSLLWRRIDLRCALYLCNIRWHMPTCAETIPSRVKEILGIAKPHVSGYSEVLWCQQLLQLVFPWCPSCRQVTGPEFLLLPDTIFQPTSLLEISMRTMYSALSWASVSSKLVGKCQILTYVKSSRYVGLLGQSSPKYWLNSYPIFCAVLELSSCCRWHTFFSCIVI